MKVETKTVTEIRVDKKEVHDTIVEVFKDLIGEEDTDSYMTVMHAREFIDAIDYLDKGELKKMLCEGYTMTLLPGVVFDKIEEFFDSARNHSPYKHELYLIITDKEEVHEKIHMDYLSY